MTKSLRWLGLGLLLGASVLLAACGEEPTTTVVSSPGITPTPTPTGVEETGNFRLLISDDQNAIGDFQNLFVTIDQIKLYATGTPITLDIPETDQKKVDLVLLQGPDAEEIIDTEIPVGTYGHVFLRVKAVEGVLIATNTPLDIKVPSTKFKINVPFEVTTDTPITFVFDITVVRQGRVNDPKGYNIQPVISESGAGQSYHEMGGNSRLTLQLDTDPQPGETATLTVIDPEGDPVPDAVVTVNDEPLVENTDSQGTLSITVPEGAKKLEIEVEKSGTEGRLKLNLLPEPGG